MDGDGEAAAASPMVAYVALGLLCADGTAEHVQDALEAVVAQPSVVIDCTGMADATPETIVCLVRCARRRGASQRKMILTGTGTYLRAVFEEAGLDRIFEIA